MPLWFKAALLFAPLTSNKEIKYQNVPSNAFSIDIDYVSIAIHIVIVLLPSPRWNSLLDSDLSLCACSCVALMLLREVAYLIR